MQRPITSGSRQAPDPYDQFLEENHLYRKHTARDASCLFRVISEQMYDSQMLHVDIRQECVRYMTQNRGAFAHYVDRDFDQYLLDLAKPKTLGTLLELRALSFMYKRNVLLYQPYDMGNYFVLCDEFKDLFRVFYTNDFHFDSVFIAAFIQDAALCQSISYDILYRMFFKIPDIEFAVEKMLHPFTFSWGAYQVEYDNNGYLTRIVAGRVFELDLPKETSCILQNYKLCRFHYNENLGPSELKRDSNEQENRDESNSETENAGILLPHRLVSCVRQLLDDGITPFPYKVAKSLDANMYRNIEFDCWSEMRKEVRRFSTYKGDNNYKIGAKCYVKLWPTDDELHACYIQDISKDKSYYVVYVEKLGEKRMVPHESLTPLPASEFKPWSVPVRLQRQFSKMNSGKARNNWKKNKYMEFEDNAECAEQQMMNNNDNLDCFQCTPSMPYESYQPPQANYITYPVSIDRPHMCGNNIDKPNGNSNEQYNERIDGNNDAAEAQGVEVMPYDYDLPVREDAHVLYNMNPVDELGQQQSVGAAAGQMPAQSIGVVDASVMQPPPINVVDAATMPPYIMVPGGFHTPVVEYSVPVYPSNMPAYYVEPCYSYPPPPAPVQHEYGPYIQLPGYQSNFQGNMQIVHLPPPPPPAGAPMTNYPVDVALMPSHVMLPSNAGMPPLIETQASVNYAANQAANSRNAINMNAANGPAYTTHARNGTHNGFSDNSTYQGGTPTLAVCPPYVIANHPTAIANNNMANSPTGDNAYMPVAPGMVFPSGVQGRVNVNATRPMRTNGQDFPTEVPTPREPNNLPPGDRNPKSLSQGSSEVATPVPVHTMRGNEPRSEIALANNDNGIPNDAISDGHGELQRTVLLAAMPPATENIQSHHGENPAGGSPATSEESYTGFANGVSSQNNKTSEPNDYTSNTKTKCSDVAANEERCDAESGPATPMAANSLVPPTPLENAGAGKPPISNSATCDVNMAPMPSAAVSPPQPVNGNNLSGGDAYITMPTSSHAVCTAIPPAMVSSMSNLHIHSTPKNGKQNANNTRRKPPTINETKCPSNESDKIQAKSEPTQLEPTVPAVTSNSAETVDAAMATVASESATLNKKNMGKKYNTQPIPATDHHGSKNNSHNNNSNNKVPKTNNGTVTIPVADTRDVQGKTSVAPTTFTPTNTNTLNPIPAGRTYPSTVAASGQLFGNNTNNASMGINDNIAINNMGNDNIVYGPQNIEPNHFMPPPGGVVSQPQLFTYFTYPMQPPPMSEPLPHSRPITNEPLPMPVYYSHKNGPPNVPFNAATVYPAAGQQQAPIQLYTQQNGFWYPLPNGQRPPLTYPPLNLAPSQMLLNTNMNDNANMNGSGY